MRWTSGLSEYLSRLLFKEWKGSNLVQWTAKESEIVEYIHHILSTDLNKEKELEKTVNQMLDELEKSHAGQFERYKMYPLLKKKMAKEKGIIL